MTSILWMFWEQQYYKSKKHHWLKRMYPEHIHSCTFTLLRNEKGDLLFLSTISVAFPRPSKLPQITFTWHFNLVTVKSIGKHSIWHQQDFKGTLHHTEACNFYFFSKRPRVYFSFTELLLHNPELNEEMGNLTLEKLPIFFASCFKTFVTEQLKMDQ